jgi:hypothetical protein
MMTVEHAAIAADTSVGNPQAEAKIWFLQQIALSC